MTQTRSAASHTVTFPLLADPDGYTACSWDLSANAQRRTYWLSLFRAQFASLLDEAIADAAARGLDVVAARSRADAAREQFLGYLDVLAQSPTAFGRLDIHQICLARQRVLDHCGFDDPYLTTKTRETADALTMLQSVLGYLDRFEKRKGKNNSGDTIDERLIKGIFAGNIFDLGAPETTELFRAGRINFRATLLELAPRPWLIDDLETWLDRLDGPPHHCAVLFVDNAGCDVVLGMIPFAKYLLVRGTGVIMTANSRPALNDVTIDELRDIFKQIAAYDDIIRDALADGRLELIASGNGSPLIDLQCISPELADAVTRRGVDLVVLEGMGRAVESNLQAKFTCEAIKIAMVKDRGVAEALGGQMYDLVFRYDKAPD